MDLNEPWELSVPAYYDHSTTDNTGAAAINAINTEINKIPNLDAIVVTTIRRATNNVIAAAIFGVFRSTTFSVGNLVDEIVVCEGDLDGAMACYSCRSCNLHALIL